MKKLVRLFPVFALILGLGASVVSVANVKGREMVRKGQVSAGQWEIVTSSYSCLTHPTKICTQLFDESNNPVAGTEEYGVYTRP